MGLCKNVVVNGVLRKKSGQLCSRMDKFKEVKTFFFIYSLKYYSGTPSYGHLVNTVASSLRPLFIGRLAKTTILFLVKKPSFIRSPRYYATIFLPIGDRINELPLDYQSETTSHKFNIAGTRQIQCIMLTLVWFKS